MGGAMIKRVTGLAVLRDGDSIFQASATRLRIADEAAGEYVIVTQCRDEYKDQSIAIEPEEWPLIRDAIEELIKGCRS